MDPRFPINHRIDVAHQLVDSLINYLDQETDQPPADFEEKLAKIVSRLIICEEVSMKPKLNAKELKSLNTKLVSITQDLNDIQSTLPQKTDEQAQMIMGTDTKTEKTSGPTSTQDKVRSHPPIDVKLTFFFDLKFTDHNGVMNKFLNRSIEGKLPAIAPRSIISQSNNQDVRDNPLETTLLKCYKEWDIYQQKDGELIIFIPKSLNKYPDDFDLNINNLTKIDLQQAFSAPERKATFDDYAALFSKHPKMTKLINVSGHGGVGSPAGMDGETYEKFLALISKNKCQGLTIFSCYAGGKNSLLHLPKEKNSAHPSRILYERRIQFPVVTRSISDLPTETLSEGYKDFGLFMQEFENFLHSKKGATIAEYRAALQRANEGAATNDLNYHLLYLPPSKGDIPGGFRPVKEDEGCFSLTYHELSRQKLSLEKAAKLNPTEKRAVVIDNQHSFELHLPVVDCPLDFQKRDPTWYSMVPGNAHHFIESIQSSNDIVKDFFNLTELQYRSEGMGANKLFLIRNEGQPYEKIAVNFEKTDRQTIYYSEGKYYYQSGNDSPQEISKLSYILCLDRWIAASRPDPKAVRSQTGGQQDEALFETTIRQHGFLGEDEDLFLQYPQIFQTDDPKPSELLSLYNTWNLTQEDENALVLHFLLTDRITLFKWCIGPRPFTNKEVLAEKAADKNNPELVKFLIERRVIDVMSPTGMKCMYAAAKNGNLELIEFLGKKNPQLYTKTGEGWPPVFGALFANDEKVLEMFQSRGADLAYQDNEGKTLLSFAAELRCARKRYPDHVEKLLEMGVNPNLGKPNPLLTAILNGDIALVKLLLDKGADINVEVDQNSPSLAVLAILKGSPKLIQLVIDHPSFKASGGNHKITPLIAAIRTGNRPLIEELFSKGIKIPADLNHGIERLIVNGLSRFKFEKDLSTIKWLLDQAENEPRIVQWLVKALIPTDCAIMMKLIKENRVDIHSEAVVEQILRRMNDGMRSYLPSSLPLLTLLRNKGALNDGILKKFNTWKGHLLLSKELIGLGCKPTGQMLTSFIATNNWELFKFAVEKGGDLNEAYNEYEDYDEYEVPEEKTTPFLKVIRRNPELIDFCLEHGAEINGGGDGVPSPLISVLKIDHPEIREAEFLRLLQAGADINQEVNGTEPLSVAIDKGDPSVIKLCLDNGAKASEKGRTGGILEYAIYRGSVKSFQLLKQYGMTISDKRIKNKDLLSVAYMNGGRELFEEVLAEVKSSPTIEKHKGMFWNKIIQNEDIEVVRKLAAFDDKRLVRELIKFIEELPSEGLTKVKPEFIAAIKSIAERD